MAHWSEKYVGMEYVHNQMDCVHLLQLVQINEFGREIDIPIERDDTVREMSLQIDTHKADYAEQVTQEEAEDGDVLLMKCRGRLNHTGVFCKVNDVDYVLHNLRTSKNVALHKLRDLQRLGLIIEGFYRFR